MIVRSHQLDAWLSPLFSPKRDMHLTFESFELEGLYADKYLYKIYTNEGPTYHYERHCSDVFLKYVEGSFQPGDLSHSLTASNLEYFQNSKPPPLPIQLERDMWRRSWYFDMLRLFRLAPDLIEVLELPKPTWVLPLPILNAFAANEQTMHYLAAHINEESHSTLTDAETRPGLFDPDHNFPHGLEYVNYQVQRSTVDRDIDVWSVLVGAMRVPNGEPGTPEYSYNDHSWMTKQDNLNLDQESPWYAEAEKAWQAYTADPQRRAIYTAVSSVNLVIAVLEDHKLRGTNPSEVDALAAVTVLDKLTSDTTPGTLPQDLAEKYILAPLKQAGEIYTEFTSNAPDSHLVQATNLIPGKAPARERNNRRQRRRR